MAFYKVWITGKHIRCLALFISSPLAWIWASVLKCRRWQLCQQPYFSREQKPSLFSASHSVSSLPKYISAPNRISPDHISGMKSPWGQLSALQTHLRVNRTVSGPNHCMSQGRGGGFREMLLLTAYLSAGRLTGRQHGFFFYCSVSLNELGKLIPDQSETGTFPVVFHRRFECFHWMKLISWVLIVKTFAASRFPQSVTDQPCQSITLANHNPG